MHLPNMFGHWKLRTRGKFPLRKGNFPCLKASETVGTVPSIWYGMQRKYVINNGNKLLF